VSVELEALKVAIEEAKKLAKARRFKQSVDLIISYSDLSTKQPEAKINETIELPHVSPERKAKVCVIAEGDLAIKAKEAADAVIGKEELNKAQGDRKYARSLARNFNFFIAQVDLMPLIGRSLGPVLGPRGKMPTPLPGTADPIPLIRKLQNSVRVRIKDSPVVQCSIGSEDMPVDQLAENAKTLIESVEDRLKVPHHIGGVFVKLSMGPAVPVKIEKRRKAA